jgi:hypothetical protein
LAETNQTIACRRVVDFFNNFRNDGVAEMTLDDVYILFYTKLLNSWKALVTTTVGDEMYYQITFNGETNETYLDVFTKAYAFCISQSATEDQHPTLFDM